MWVGGALWLTRDSLSAYAPGETATVFHLTPTTGAWRRLLEDFGHVTVVSGRFLTLREVATLSPKEVAIFVDAFGGRSVAIRATLEANVRHELETYGISIQELGPHQFLLSSQPLPFSINRRTSFDVRRIVPSVFGSIRAQQSDRPTFSSPLSMNSRGYATSLPKVEASPLSSKRLPQNTIAAMSMPSLTNKLLEPVTNQLETILRPINADIVSNLAEAMNRKDVVVVYAKDEAEKPNFLLRLAKKVNATDLLRTISSLKNPRERDFTLPDGSHSTELYVDPDNMTVEEVVMAGKTVQRVQTPDGQFLATEDENWLYLATNEHILTTWLNAATSDGPFICSKNPFLFINVDDILTLVKKERMQTANSWEEVFIEFQEISLSSGFFSSKLTLCR